MKTDNGASRFVLISSKSFEKVIAALEAAVGHPDLRTFHAELGAARGYSEMEATIKKAEGSSGFIEMFRFDLGTILRKETGKQSPKSVRFLIGNPLIMKEMLRHVPDAGSYAPVTILVDERPDGVHLSYDQMAGLLEPYKNAAGSKVAQDLDLKVRRLLEQVAG